MNPKEIYNHLTPAAQEEFQSRITKYKEELLSEAYKKAKSEQDVVKEISLSDVIAASTGSRNKEIQVSYIKERSEKRDRYYRVLSLSGILYSLIGLIIYLYQNNFFETKTSWGLIVVAVGILFTLAGIVLRTNNSYKLGSNSTSWQDSTSGQYEIVERWRILEKIAKSKTQNDLKSNKVTSAIDFYRKILSEDEFMKLKMLLDTRNRVLHDDYTPSKSQLVDLLNFSEEIISRIEKV